MPTIKTRKQANGTTRYTAIVRIRRGGAILHHEARTFAHRSAALTWARHREVTLEEPSAFIRAHERPPSLGELIDWYIETFARISRWQRSKQAHLEFLRGHSIAARNTFTLTASILIDHVRARRAAGAGPATAANDLVWIGVVLRAAKSLKELPLRPDIVQEARTACRELRLIGKARKRTRRPTPDELQRLKTFFAARDRRAAIPMVDIMEFAIQSARREAEICRLRWQDNDEGTRTGVVTDAKHPTQRAGNHRRFKYTPEGWAIIARQPRSSEYIFPYEPRSIGAAFTRACKLLGIADLRFHDLRHEATSRLFERGYHIHEVAQFTLHDSWSELKRYANLRPETVREIATPPRAAPADISRRPRAVAKIRAAQPVIRRARAVHRSPEPDPTH